MGHEELGTTSLKLAIHLVICCLIGSLMGSSWFLEIVAILLRDEILSLALSSPAHDSRQKN